MNLIPILAPIAGLFAVFIVITLGFLCCRCWLPRRSISTKASSADLKACPVPNEVGVPDVINTQPEPSNEGIMEPPDEEALSLSTTTDLPTTPMGVYDPNDASRLPEPQDDLNMRGVSSLEIFGGYEGSGNIPRLANMRVSSLSQPQGYSGLPTFPEPRYDQYSRSVPQDSFGQHQGTENTLRQTNMQVSPPGGHSDLPPSPEPQGGLYVPSVSPLVIGGQPSSPEPQDEAYSPSVSPRVIFGQRRGTGNTLAR